MMCAVESLTTKIPRGCTKCAVTRVSYPSVIHHKHIKLLRACSGTLSYASTRLT
jgi:hypothetical protein